MSIRKWRREVRAPGLPDGYGLIVSKRPDEQRPRWWGVKMRWFCRLQSELPVVRSHVDQHVDQRVLLEKRYDVKVPVGKWIALCDPLTADPKLFKRAGNKPHSDKVMQFIQVTAALALELAVSGQRLRLVDSSQKIARELGRAGLLSPSDRKKHYKHHTVKKWRDQHKHSDLYKYGLSLFRGHPWTDVLDIACTEARLRTALHRLHEEDPNGSKARAGFEDFLDELWEEQEKVQREYFFPEASR